MRIIYSLRFCPNRVVHLPLGKTIGCTPHLLAPLTLRRSQSCSPATTLSSLSLAFVPPPLHLKWLRLKPADTGVPPPPLWRNSLRPHVPNRPLTQAIRLTLKVRLEQHHSQQVPHTYSFASLGFPHQHCLLLR